ncbi:MAG: hypothetical protein JW784_03620 [Candidatus Cloacimonetes bacterium]|nr:hypothetical protein [Candidatus Cloacimonadota bacterium]
MKQIIKAIVSVLGWLVLLAALGSLGFTSDDPSVGVPIFLGFFILVFILVYLYIKSHHRKTQTNPRLFNVLHRLIGLILLLLSLLSPLFVFRSAHFPFFSYLIITLIAGIIIALGVMAVTMINNSRNKKSIIFLGYLLLIILSAIPALLMMTYDSSYNALGMAYYTAVLIAVFSWWGFTLLTPKR